MTLRDLFKRCAGGVRSCLDTASLRPKRAGLALGLVVGMALWAPALQPQAAGPAGHTYFVDSAKGSDSNSGTAPDQAWRTLASVNGADLEPGDVVNLAAGSTFDGGLVMRASGAEGKPITVQAYGSGDKPVIANTAPGGDDIRLDGDWIVVDGVSLRAAEHGVRIGESAAHNVVRNSEAVGVGIGAGVYGQDNLITHNNFHDLKMVVNTQGGDDDYGAYAIGLYSSNNEVSYNRMERCKAPSYDYGEDGGAIEFFEDVSGTYIHHNWAQDNAGFIEVGGGSAVDTRVVYNVAVNNGTFAWFHLSGNFAADVKNFRVENNTIVETTVSQNTHEVFGFSKTPSVDTLVLRNNIFYINDYKYLSSKSGYTHDHNIYRFLQSKTQLGTSLGEGEKLADPQFVNAGGGDYRLQSGSPATGAGANLGYGQDYAGTAVPSGSAPDAGAYQQVKA